MKEDQNIFLNVDGYSRFFVLAQILKGEFADKENFSLCDVGGRSEFMSNAIDAVDIKPKMTIVDPILLGDLKLKDYQSYICGDFTKNKFKDNQFDAVISTDVLEHIPDKLKLDFIDECIRVANDIVIIAAPFYSNSVVMAEKNVRDFYQIIMGRDHKWLKEHEENVLPNIDDLILLLKKKKLNYQLISSNNLIKWQMGVLANFMAEADLLNMLEISKTNQYYNKNIMRIGDFLGPAYRTIVVINKRDIPLKNWKEYFNKVVDPRIELTYQDNLFKLISHSLKLVIEKVDSYEKLEQLTPGTNEIDILRENVGKYFVLNEQNDQLETELTALKNEYNSLTQSKFFKSWTFYIKLKKLLFRIK